MAIVQKIDKLIAGEIISLTFVITSAISSIMMMARLPKYADFLFSAPHLFTSFLMLLLYILPSILKLTVPVSLLLSCSIVTMRMSTDRELEAWMSCGVSVIRLAFMPSLLGVCVVLISLASALYFEPYSNKQYEKFKWLQTRSLVEAFIKGHLKEKAFIYDFQGSNNANPLSNEAKLALYFGKINSSKTALEKIFIAFSDPEHPYSSVIVAKTGELSNELVLGYPDYIFKLHDGFIYSYQIGKDSLSKLLENPQLSHYDFSNKLFKNNALNLYPPPVDWTITRYANLNISLVNLFKDKFKNDNAPQNQIEQLYPKEYFALIEQEKKKSSDWRRDIGIIEQFLFFMKQISIPLSTIFLPVIGICLGILDPRKKQISVYFGIGLVIFALYSSISLCQQLALKFIISPYFMLFITPSVLISIMFILLRWRLIYPPSCHFIEFLKNDFAKLTIGLKQKIFLRRRKLW